MRSVSVRLCDLENIKLNMGYVGENEHVHVLFDCKKAFEQYPNAVPSLVVVPPKGDSYPAVVTREGDIVEWVITDSDLIYHGNGKVQLQFQQGDVVMKSAEVRTFIAPSAVASGTIPTPIQNWIAQANAILAEIPEDINTALAAAQASGAFDGVGIVSITKTSASGNVDTYTILLTDESSYDFTVTNGTPGQDGIDGVGIQSIAKTGTSGLIDTYTITLTNNQTYDFTVTNGENGVQIDDVTPANNKVFSSSKVDEELTQVKNDIQGMNTATASDVGKALSPKTVVDGEVTEWQFKSISGGGGSVDVDDDFSTSSENPVQNKVITAVVNDITEKKVSPNLYDKNSCHPQDKTVYNNSHSYTSSNSYAVTGKIPVQPSTKYKFWAGEGVNIKYVAQWSGETGETFVSETNISSAAFTTGANTTFVEFEIFARSHTTEEYNAAIDCAMLVEGETIPETYQPYGQVTYDVPTNALEDREAVEGAKNYTVMRSLVNIYDKTLARDNKVFNTNQVVDNANYAFTGLIPVEPNSQYCFSIQKGLEYGYISSYYQRWNASGEFIDEVSGNQPTNFLNQIHTTAQTAYVSFCIYFGAAHTTEAFETAIDTVMVVEGCQEPAEYVPYNLEPVMNHKKLDTAYRDNADRFKGKRWLAFGTSVTYQDSKYYTEGVADGEVVRGYIGNVVRRKPMIVFNEGVSGSTLAGSDTHSLINRYQNFTYTDYDFVTIEYGINDFGNNVPVGAASDAAGTSTFAACLKTIIEYILTANPIIGLIICTDPHVRDSTNNNSNTLKDYVDVTLEIAKQYSLPVCDWFYHSGINSITKGDGTSRYFLTQSGTHPSVYGHMRMGAMLNQVFDSLVC